MENPTSRPSNRELLADLSYEKYSSWEAATHDVLILRKAFVRMCGGHFRSSILLSQILYWHRPTKKNHESKLRVLFDGKMWIAKDHHEWTAETCLSQRDLVRCFQRLTDLGLIEVIIKRFNGTPMRHVRIVGSAFMLAWTQHVEDAPGTPFTWADD